MSDTTTPVKGLYRGQGGIWVIDKVINGRRIKRSTKATDFNVAVAVLDRETRMLNTRLLGERWEQEVDAMAADPRSWLHRMAQSLSYRGKRMGKGCSLAVGDLEQVLRRSGGRCEITGIGFDMRKPAKGNTPPFHPSFDRRDSSLGYTYANTRVVCLCVNLCIRDWGEDVMHRIGRALVLKEMQESLAPTWDTSPPKVGAQRKTA